MSDLFNTGKAKRKGGSLNVSYKGAPDIVKKLRKLEDGGKVAINRTVSDFSTRAPAWVSKGIREHYGVDTASINNTGLKRKKGATKIKLEGTTVDDLQLIYSGRLLTPTHFKMSPKTRPDGNKKYKIRATIIKGQRTALPGGAFLAPAKKETKSGEPATIIPWQRRGKERTPTDVIKTVSVPQMIDGRARETIEEAIGEKLGERFQHHIKQAMK